MHPVITLISGSATVSIRVRSETPVAGREPRRDLAVDVDEHRAHPGLDGEVVEDPRVADRHQRARRGSGRSQSRLRPEDDHAGDRTRHATPKIGSHICPARGKAAARPRCYQARSANSRVGAVAGDPPASAGASSAGPRRRRITDGHAGQSPADIARTTAIGVGDLVIDAEQAERARGDQPRPPAARWR